MGTVSYLKKMLEEIVKQLNDSNATNGERDRINSDSTKDTEKINNDGILENDPSIENLQLIPDNSNTNDYNEIDPDNLIMQDISNNDESLLDISAIDYKSTDNSFSDISDM